LSIATVGEELWLW